MYKPIMFAIAAAILLTAFVTVASFEFSQAVHAQNATAGGMKNATAGAASNSTGGAGANMTKK